MANPCFYRMKLTGAKEQEAKKLIIDLLDYEAGEVSDQGEDFWGYCKWSVKNGLIDGYESSRGLQINLPSICKNLNIAAEVYGYESGNDFVEHYAVNAKGEIIAEECEDGVLELSGVDEEAFEEGELCDDDVLDHLPRIFTNAKGQPCAFSEFSYFE